MNLSFSLSCVSAALSLAGYNALLTSLMLLFKKRDPLTVAFFISSLTVSGWALSLTNLFHLQSLPNLEMLARLAHICFFLMPLGWLYFVLVYTGRLKKSRTMLFLAAAAVLLFLLSPATWFIQEIRQTENLWFVPVPGPAFKALSVLFFFIFILGFWEFWDCYAEEKSLLKKQDYWILFYAQLYGALISSLWFLPVYGLDIPPWYFCLLPLWQFFLAYALVRRHLLSSEELASEIHRDKLASMVSLAAGMHHELKNPLTAIKTFAEFLPEKQVDPEFRKKFSEIVPREVGRVTKILNQLLDFSKPAEPEFQILKISLLIEEMLTFLKHQMEQASVKVLWDNQFDALVKADIGQMKQVLLNLFFNALQAMPEGGTLKITAREGRQNSYRLLVDDTGPGISPELQEKIFEPFFTTKEKGTGLGLFIVRQIVEKHGGRIRFENLPAGGGRFEVLLPAASSGV